FFPPAGAAGADLDRFAGALVEIGNRGGAAALPALRKALDGKPVGSVSLKGDAALLRRSARLGFDFHLGSWRRGDPPAKEVLAHLGAARRTEAGGRPPMAQQLKKTAQRLAILTDIVKTANSILEPRKVIELIMAKIQQLIPSEAWSMLMVDEEKQELTFELALGEKGRDVSSFRVKMGEGIAGWVAQTGQPTIVNDTSKDPRFARRFDASTHFQTRSVLCAPLISRGRTIGVVQVINKRGGKFTQADLELLLTLVEPCAISLENAILFQRTEHIRKAIESHVFLRDAGLEARISASFGIASYPDHALTPEGLIQKADQAMYRVKERDKNGIEVAV